MTASSVDFIPCRVPLMGLPRSSTSLSASDTSSTLVNSRPVVSKLRRVSRNLFGTPNREEMRNLYQQEAERQHSYVLKRYNFDTKTSKPTYFKEQQPTVQPTQLPTLIQQELVQHEQRLHDEKHNLNRSLLESNTPVEKISNEKKSSSKVFPRYLAYTFSPSLAHDRQKPYTRQPLLKESFNIRKNKVCVTENDTELNGLILKKQKNVHQNPGVLQLPQPINSQHLTKAFDGKNSEIECSTYDVSDREQGRVESDQSTAISCNENGTTFSLQLVVSTRNVS